MYCNVCGTELQGANFCPNCGAAAGTSTAPNNNYTSNNYSGGNYAGNYNNTAPPSGVSRLDYTTMLLLTILVGGLGVHRFYANKIGTGILWLLTGGCFGIGWIVDIVLVATEKFTDSDGNVILNNRR